MASEIKKPIILILGEDGIGGDGTPLNVLREAYGQAIILAGGFPVWGVDIRSAEQYVEISDGLLLTDGLDVHVYRFGEMYREAKEMHPISRTRDDLDFRLCELFIQHKKPIFGIGRGMQILNICLGGSLVKSLAEAGIPHPGSNPIPALPPQAATLAYHGIRVEKNTPLEHILSTIKDVSSCHTRAVQVENSSMLVAAKGEDEVIEAIVHPEQPWIGVQWHPELDLVKNPAHLELLNYWISLIKEEK